jgi:signal transduction histidine kinase
MPGDNTRLPAHLETLLFRVTQEAVNNIVRHAGAKNVVIRLYQDASEVCLEVADDGHGFDVATTTSQAVYLKQLGLLGIRERVSLVHGRLKIQSEPGRGTCLQICVPTFLENGAGS